jgi:hypothetical protein
VTLQSLGGIGVLASFLLHARASGRMKDSAPRGDPMPRLSTMVTAVLLAVAPLPAWAGALQLRLGGFFPQADSTLFQDDSALYFVGQDDWNGFSGGLEYTMRLTQGVHLGFHVDGYTQTVHTSYRDFVHESGREIQQSLQLDVVPLGVSVHFVPIDRRGKVTPYILAGADVFFYEYEEWGEFVDFDSPDLDVLNDSFVSYGATPGFHVAVGLRVPLNRDWSLFGEGRYQWAKADMGDDFRGSELDMSGVTATFGVRLQF